MTSASAARGRTTRSRARTVRRVIGRVSRMQTVLAAGYCRTVVALGLSSARQGDERILTQFDSSPQGHTGTRALMALIVGV